MADATPKTPATSENTSDEKPFELLSDVAADDELEPAAVPVADAAEPDAAFEPEPEEAFEPEADAVAEPLAAAPVAEASSVKMADDAYVWQFEDATTEGVYGMLVMAPSDSGGCEYDCVAPVEST